MNNENEKYLIHLEGSERNPSFLHDSKEQALTEAKRLAKTYNKKAWIFKAITTVELNEFKITELESDYPLDSESDSPF